MPVLLDKILSALAYPLGLALMILAAGLLAGCRWPRMGRTAGLAALIILWAASTPLTASWAIRSLETQFHAQRVEDYPFVDVVIVLGGGVSVPGIYNPYPDLGAGGDRVLHAYRILKAGRARKVLLSGGLTFDPDAAYAEADAMADILVSLGIDRNLLILERRSRTTRENADQSRRIWKEQGFQTGLLVTSAFHMPRALATFHRAGLPVLAAVTDVNMADGALPLPLAILPDAASLAMTTIALKEWLGLFVYRWRGWA